MTLTLDDRERDTIIAALRYWQKGISDPHGRMVSSEFYEIAENDRTGDDAFLAPSEIDALIEERINV